MKTPWMLYCFLWLALSGGTANAIDVSKLQGLSELRFHQLESNVDGDPPYYIYVRLPEEMAEADVDTRYPVVYLLDGGVTFAPLAGYYRYLRLAEEVSPLIIVGISYGTSDWREGNRRSVDYTLPTAEQAHWGGAERFDRWLESRLLPLIETEYPADPARRIIFGQSLGGQFAIHEAMFKPDRFWGHIASNAALHRNLELFLSAPEQRPAVLPRLFVVGGSDDNPRFAEPRGRWIAHWQSQPAPPFELQVTTLPGDNHFSALTGAFRHGLIWLFEE